MVKGVGLRLLSLSVEQLDEEGFVGSNPTPRTMFSLQLKAECARRPSKPSSTDSSGKAIVFEENAIGHKNHFDVCHLKYRAHKVAERTTNQPTYLFPRRLETISPLDAASHGLA